MGKCYNNILIIMPKFFGYEMIIKEHFTSLGSNVKTVFENLSEINYFYRLCKIYFPQLMPFISYHYYLKHIKTDSKYDLVLVIRGSSVTKQVLEHIRLNYSTKESKFVLYLWDSINNNPNTLDIYGFFDKVLTFDPKDAKQYRWNYRPLFFISEYVHEGEKREIDLLYNCTLHSKRVDLLNRITTLCNNKGYVLNAHVFCKRLLFLKGKYINKKIEFLNANSKNISFKPLSIEQSYELYNKSRVVVDYTHPGQVGFTMRTIEALGTKCKIVTNNALIRDADFYNQNNIYVYDEDSFTLPKEFLEKPYEDIDDKVYDFYSIDSWLKDMLTV